MATETRRSESTATGVTLLLAFELAAKKWMLGLMRSDGGPVRRRQVGAGDTARVGREIAAAQAAFGLPADAAVPSCYEAGRDGFWLHRWLETPGVQNRVVDSSSIEVPRRMRRVKTDTVDLDG